MGIKKTSKMEILIIKLCHAGLFHGLKMETGNGKETTPNYIDLR